VTANADLLAVSGPYNGGARTYVNIDAGQGQVRINGPFLATANVVSEGQAGGNASANATTDIHGARGVTLGNATVTANASAQGGGLGQNALAQSLLKITADNGNISGKSMQDNATAVHKGTGGKGIAKAKAMSWIDATNGNVTITADRTLALASGVSGPTLQGQASADIILHAGRNVAVTAGGLDADAQALMPQAQKPVRAISDIDVTAGKNITLRGNVTAVARAFGAHSGQHATADILVHAGTAGFGKLSVFGNVLALASADPVNDHAQASVSLIANQILIVGANPTAVAIAGDLTAYNKSRRTKRVSVHGAHGTSAVAGIFLSTDPGGLIIINGSSTGLGINNNPNADALQALPIYNQVFPSGSLYAVPLSIDGKPCGVLGGGGAKKGAAAGTCPSPINVSGVVDGP